MELRGLGGINDELRQLGVSLLAISVDAPADSRDVVERLQLPFPILADPSRDLIRKLGLLHKGGGPGGSDIAIPTLLLIDRDNNVRWSHFAERIHDRLSADEVLIAVRKALSTP